MQRNYSVTKPAQNINLVTLYEAKVALFGSADDTTNDDRIEIFIKWASAEIARLCNRTLAKETGSETFRDLSYAQTLFLSHYPIISIDSVTDNGEAITSDLYEVDKNAGTITLLSGYWTEPVIVTYTGGYDVPFEAPPDLSQAAMLLTKDSYYSALRGDSTVRMVAHKESRIMYYDPNQLARSGVGGGGGEPGSGNVGSPTRRAVVDLIRRYQRFWV